jgi:hypothetical protein
VRFYRSDIPQEETTVRDGIATTTAVRTLFDLAGVVPARHLGRAVKEAEVRRLWDPLSLADLLERHPRRPGAAALRAIVGVGATGTRSDLEDLFAAFVDEIGLERPVTNTHVWAGGRWLEADCVWRSARLIVELDGRTFHDTPTAFETDRARDRALTVAGWRLIRVTWRQLHRDRPALARDLRAALMLDPVANLRRA